MASTATATGAVPTASQRNCWRSTPRALRKRTTSDAAPIGMASPAITKVTPRATGSHTSKARTASGSATDWSGSVNGPSTDDSNPTTAASAATLAHQRQRGEGSDPVGVSSRMKPMQAAIQKNPTSLAADPTAGGAPRQASST